jgi:hypothetical protein
VQEARVVRHAHYAANDLRCAGWWRVAGLHRPNNTKKAAEDVVVTSSGPWFATGSIDVGTVLPGSAFGLGFGTLAPFVPGTYDVTFTVQVGKKTVSTVFFTVVVTGG